MNISQRIKELRIKADKTQEEIAKILNIKQEAYNRYERDKSTIPTKYIIELAKYYNISADYILGLTEEKKKLY